MVHKCTQCGCTFSAQGKRTRKFCSMACYNAAKNAAVLRHTCLFCSKNFTVAGRRPRKFCGDSCYRLHERHLMMIKSHDLPKDVPYCVTKKLEMKPRFCLNCKKPIPFCSPSMRTPNLKQYAKKMYCCRVCVWVHTLDFIEGESLFEKFRRKVGANPSDLKSCWNAPDACITEYGYGFLSYRDKKYALHRVSYQYFKGNIAPGLVVRHDCDNRACWNPSHLQTGTAHDNIQDMIRRGRKHQEGKNFDSPRTIISKAQAKDLIDRVRSGERTRRQMAEEYGFTVDYINHCWRKYKDFDFT